jgi:hypothetical protein
MPRCAGFKPDGSACERIVGASQRLCFSHDPARKAERQRNAARAGRGSGATEIRALRKLLEDLTTRVVEGTLESGRGAVAAQLVNTRIRLMEHARRVREQEELEERMAEIERRLEDAHGRIRGA